MSSQLPGARAAIADNQGLPTPEFYRFLLGLQRLSAGSATSADIAALQTQITAIQSEIDGLPKSSFPTLQVAAPVYSQGLLQNGFAKIGVNVANSVIVNGTALQLAGDVAAPGNTYLYSTGPTGAKGWNALGGMLAGTTDRIAKTINADGSVTLDLAPSITQPTTGKFFTQAGATIQRFNDRVFVGGATESSGDYPQTTDDWLSAFERSVGYISPSAPSMVFASTNDSKDSASAITGAAQTLNFVATGAACIGVESFAVNNNSTLATDAWAFYGEAHLQTDAARTVIGMELDTRSTVATNKPDPFGQGIVVGLQLASGCGLSATGQFDGSAAIQIWPNPMKFQAGIVFGANAITGADGTGGGNQGTAIALGPGHKIEWYGSSGSVVGRILSNSTSAANATGINFTNSGMQVHSIAAGNPSILFVSGVANGVNFMSFTNAVAGQPPFFSAGGADTDVDLMFLTKGAGVLRFGTFTSGALSASGYITVKDRSGIARKLLCA